MSNKLTIEENLSLILQTKTQFKNDIKDLGGSINDNTPFSDYPPIYKQIAQSGGGGSGECVDSGYAIEVSTHEEMDALLVDSNLNKLYKFVGTSDDTYVNGMIYMVVESDTVIPSGVGATLYQEGGYEPLPIGEVVESATFNTSLSVSEVQSILANANFIYPTPEQTAYVAFHNSETNTQLGIMDYGALFESSNIFVIMGNLGGKGATPIWLDPSLKDTFGVTFEGWNNELFTQLGGNTIPLGISSEATCVDGDVTFQVGSQNEAISQIINIGEKGPEKKQLKGDYYAVSINSINNGRLDLMSYINKNQIPTKININVPDVPPILQELEFYPDRFYHEYEPEDGYDGFSKVITRGVSSNVDSNIQPYNIKKGVWILGTLGTFEDTLKVLLDAKKSAYMLLYNFSESSIDNMFQSPNVTSEVTDMMQMCENSLITTFPLLDTKKVTRMTKMFYNCTKLKTINFLDTSNVTDMTQMFYGCANLTTLPNELNTSNVEGSNMSQMFYGCSSLKKIPYMDTSKVTNMSEMFYGCGVEEMPLLNTSNVTDMSRMFERAGGFKTCPQFDTSKVTTMYAMFLNCGYRLESVPSLDTSQVKTMDYMFCYCYNLKSIGTLNMINVTSAGQMFNSVYVTNLTLLNIKANLEIPRTLNFESLMNTFKECINVGTNKKLTISTEGMEKITNTYVRLTNQPEEDENNPKLPMEICESTDDGAMTISEYMALKNWTLA